MDLAKNITDYSIDASSPKNPNLPKVPIKASQPATKTQCDKQKEEIKKKIIGRIWA
ncbi:MAG: hypothetical protein ACR9NN_17995 [Nostochopsis sp.]